MDCTVTKPDLLLTMALIALIALIPLALALLWKHIDGRQEQDIAKNPPMSDVVAWDLFKSHLTELLRLRSLMEGKTDFNLRMELLHRARVFTGHYCGCPLNYMELFIDIGGLSEITHGATEEVLIEDLRIIARLTLDENTEDQG